MSGAYVIVVLQNPGRRLPTIEASSIGLSAPTLSGSDEASITHPVRYTSEDTGRNRTRALGIQVAGQLHEAVAHSHPSPPVRFLLSFHGQTRVPTHTPRHQRFPGLLIELTSGCIASLLRLHTRQTIAEQRIRRGTSRRVVPTRYGHARLLQEFCFFVCQLDVHSACVVCIHRLLLCGTQRRPRTK